MAKVEIVFAHHHGDHVPGEKVKVDEDEARRLVKNHRAAYATKSDAKAAGDDGPTPATRPRARTRKVAAKPAAPAGQ